VIPELSVSCLQLQKESPSKKKMKTSERVQPFEFPDGKFPFPCTVAVV
jgi:hypothetical protein